MKSRTCALILLLLVASCGLADAQTTLTPGTPPVEWTWQFTGTSSQTPCAIAVDATGVYVGGHCLLTKLNTDGSEQWHAGEVCTYYRTQRFTGLAPHGTALFAASNDWVRMPGAGAMAGATRFDTTTGSAAWSDSIRVSGGMVFGSAVAASATGVYVAGLVQGQLVPDQTGNAFVRAYDPTGSLDTSSGTTSPVHLWTHQFGSTGAEVISPALAIDETGAYVTGEMNSPDYRGFLRKYALDGTQVLWTVGWPDEIIPRAISTDATGVYIAGVAWGSVSHGFVRKYDTNGNELWTRECGTINDDEAVAIAADGTGVYVTGRTYGAFPGYTNSGQNTDVFVRKYDGESNVVWTYQFGTGLDEQPQAIAVDDTAVYVAGHTGSDGFVVKLNQAQMVPTLTLPPDQTAEATGASGAAVTFTASATDWADHAVEVTCDATSGSTFPVGTTTVTCTAVDVHDNTSQGTFMVTVMDTTAPTLTVPADMSVTATVAGGAYVTFSPSATDLVDGPVAVGCTPASGSLFGTGTSTVACDATDQHGNRVVASFNVTVTFAWSGYLHPVNADNRSVFKLGSTVPVKFRLSGDSAPITSLYATISIAPVSDGVVGDEFEAVSTAAADGGNAFRYDPTAGQYIFNWGTRSLSTGTYQICIEFGDGLTRAVIVSLKK